MEISSHDLYEAIKWIVLVLHGKQDAKKPDLIKDILLAVESED